MLISSAGITSPDEVPAKLVPSPVIELEPTKPWTVGLLENERQENLLLPKGPKEPSCPGTQRDNKAEVTGTGQEAGEKPIAPQVRCPPIQGRGCLLQAVFPVSLEPCLCFGHTLTLCASVGQLQAALPLT